MPAGRPRRRCSSQSGALGIAILELAGERGVGISTFVSVGNKADVSGNDLLQYWESDPETRVILLYLESFGNPRRFARIARRVGRTKPIVAVKAGRSRAGPAPPAATPPPSPPATWRSTRCFTRPASFAPTPSTRCSTSPRASMASRCRTAGAWRIVTNAGGPGILAVDACEAAGLSVVDVLCGDARRLAGVPAG